MAKGKRKPLSESEKLQRTKQKQANFVRLAKQRMSVALKRIEIVGNCFSPAYVWTPEQAHKVCEALVDAVAKVTARSTKVKQEADTFDF